MAGEYRPHLKDRLRQAFERGGDADIMRRVQTPEQLREIARIKDQAQALREKVRGDHREKYDVRVKHMMSRVRDEWTRPNLTLKPDFARLDRLDIRDIELEAERRVRKRFESLLVRIDGGELRQLRKVVGLPDRAPPERPVRFDGRQPSAEPERTDAKTERSKLRLVFDRARERMPSRSRDDGR